MPYILLSLLFILHILLMPAGLAHGVELQLEANVALSVPAKVMPAKVAEVRLFGSREIKSRSIKSFAKWSEMWRRHNLPRRADEPAPMTAGKVINNCETENPILCGRNRWEKFITRERDVPFTDMLNAVNHFMNQSTYIVDPVNWGIPDYWATPDEFFLKDGDCEDYAISKYITLKRLGVDPSLMRLVILQDENLRVAHAVLAVKQDDHYMILDNQVNAILPDTKILHYRPVYSINESGWWLHHRRRFKTE